MRDNAKSGDSISPSHLSEGDDQGDGGGDGNGDSEGWDVVSDDGEGGDNSLVCFSWSWEGGVFGAFDGDGP